MATSKTFTKGDLTITTSLPSEQVQLRLSGWREETPSAHEEASPGPEGTEHTEEAEEEPPEAPEADLADEESFENVYLDDDEVDFDLQDQSDN